MPACHCLAPFMQPYQLDLAMALRVQRVHPLAMHQTRWHQHHPWAVPSLRHQAAASRSQAGTGNTSQQDEHDNGSSKTSRLEEAMDMLGEHLSAVDGISSRARVPSMIPGLLTPQSTPPPTRHSLCDKRACASGRFAQVAQPARDSNTGNASPFPQSRTAQMCAQATASPQTAGPSPSMRMPQNWPHSLVLTHEGVQAADNGHELTLCALGSNSDTMHAKHRQTQAELLQARESNCALRANLLEWKQSYAQLQAELHCACHAAHAEQGRAVAECLLQAERGTHYAAAGLQVCS